MNKRKHIDYQSALLVSSAVIIGAFIGAIISWAIAFNELAVLLMSLSVVGLFSRLWGMHSLDSVELECKDDRLIICVGQKFTSHYTIRNNKLLPLIWIDLCMDIPARDCIIATSEIKKIEFEKTEGEILGRSSCLLKRFAFLAPYSELEWDVEWTGNKRGVFIPKNPIMRSGDGFGLCQSFRPVDKYPSKCYVVWPQIIDVNIDRIVKNVFDGKTPRHGYFEDISLLRNEREYKPTDLWKRIDWRSLARSDELLVKEYETISPQSFVFILDINSFDDKEKAISVLASCLFKLNQSGFLAGISIPVAGSERCRTIEPSENSFNLSMYALSALDEEAATDDFDIDGIMSVANSGSSIWIISDAVNKPAVIQIRDRLHDHRIDYISNSYGNGVSFPELIK